MPLDDEFRGPAAVTVLYFLVYYSFMIYQLNTRGAAIARTSLTMQEAKRQGPLDNEALMGERTFLNALEQQGAFLAALWSCAACVSCGLATVLGGIAVFARLLFPVFWALRRAARTAESIQNRLSTISKSHHASPLRRRR